MTIILAILLASAVLAAPVIHRLKAFGATILAIPMMVVVGFLLNEMPDVLAGKIEREVFANLPLLSAEIAFRLDGLGLLFSLLVCVIGALVLIYAGGYFSDKPSVLARFSSFAYLFAAAMIGLVVADDLLTLFISWELTSVCSFLLIGLKHDDSNARSGAMRALLVTGAGGVALLVGLLLLADIAGTTSISTLLERGDDVRSSSAYLFVLGLIAFAAFTKSAQAPFHYWLPGAMAAPGPISAFLHSATLVKAGVFLLARLHPVLGFRPEWNVLLGHVGAITLIVGATLAFAQNDLKRMLAYTTLAGLGTLVLLLGIGTEPALKAALLFVTVHALYKASLFLIVGYLEKRTGTRDVTQLGGLLSRTPIAFVAAILAALSMSGLPPLLGAISKELVYEAKLGAPEAPILLTIVGSLGNALVICCAIMVGLSPFFRRHKPPQLRQVPAVRLLLGPLILAALGMLLGILHDTTAAPILDAALTSVVSEPVTVEFTLDASPQLVSWLGKLTILAGLLAFAFRLKLLQLLAPVKVLDRLGPTALHDYALNGILGTGSFLSNIFSRDGIRQSLIWPLLLVSAIGAVLLMSGTENWNFPELDLNPLRALLLLLVVAGALGTVCAKSTYTAVTALGITGFGVGMLFLVLGGPDLAKTQVAVETLAVLLLLLVLGRKPIQPEASRLPMRIGRILIAVTVGMTFTLLIWSAAPDGNLSQLASELAQKSVPEGYGRNVVNVTLVDFRALDTMGEVFVLAIAAIGVTLLLGGVTKKNSDSSSSASQKTLIRSPILRAAARTIVPLLGLISLVLLVRGHHEPGGGFVGGLVASAAVLLHSFAFGYKGAGARIISGKIIAIGLAVVLTSGAIGLLAGGTFLEGMWLSGKVPAVGKLGTPLLFDAGVYLVVLGVSTKVLFGLLEREGDLS